MIARSMVLLLVVAGSAWAVYALGASLTWEGDSGSLVQSLTCDREAYKVGEKVRLSYTVRNESSRPITCRFSSSKVFDLWITSGSTEIHRLSRGKSYLTVITNLTLRPDQERKYEVVWDQKDLNGQQVPKGAYVVHAQLSPCASTPPPTTTTLEIRDGASSPVRATIPEAISRFGELKGQTVEITANYRGWRANGSYPNVKDGPPVTRSDWAICDDKGCMYVTGKCDLDPMRDVGKRIVANGELRKTDRGQVYLVLKENGVRAPGK